MTVLEQFKSAIERSKKEHVPLLQARLGELNTEIEAGEEEVSKAKANVSKKRDERNAIMSELRKIDPALAPSLYPGRETRPKKNGNSKPAGEISAEKMAQLQAWLEEHRHELNANGGFRPVDIYTREDFEVIKSDSAVNKALNTLREEGYLKLDRWVRGKPQPGHPTGKFYKFV